MDSRSEFATGACRNYEAALEDYLNGALEGAELRRVAMHLKTCSGCAGAVEEGTAANQWLREVESPTQPGPAFARTVMARIHAHQEVARASFWEPLTALAWKFAATSALVLLLMLTFASHRAASVAADVVTAADQTDDVSDMFAPGHSSVPDTRWELFMAPEEGENGSHH